MELASDHLIHIAKTAIDEPAAAEREYALMLDENPMFPDVVRYSNTGSFVSLMRRFDEYGLLSETGGFADAPLMLDPMMTMSHCIPLHIDDEDLLDMTPNDYLELISSTSHITPIGMLADRLQDHCGDDRDPVDDAAYLWLLMTVVTRDRASDDETADWWPGSRRAVDGGPVNPRIGDALRISRALYHCRCADVSPAQLLLLLRQADDKDDPSQMKLLDGGWASGVEQGLVDMGDGSGDRAIVGTVSYDRGDGVRTMTLSRDLAAIIILTAAWDMADWLYGATSDMVRAQALYAAYTHLAANRYVRDEETIISMEDDSELMRDAIDEANGLTIDDLT